MKFRPKAQFGIFINFFLKTEGIFSADNFFCERTQLFPVKLTLVIAHLVVLVIVG